MVGKLLKHDLYALFRVLMFFMIGTVVLAAVGRGLLAVSEKREGFELITLLVCLFYIFSALALIIAAYCLGISRFYKTLFTGEGYLTLSLPASPSQLLGSKLLSSLIAVVAASAVSIGACSLFFIGWEEDSLIHLILELFSSGFSSFRLAISDPLSAVEFAVYLVVSLPMMLLVAYAVLCIGQMFTKRRKLYSFLIFLGVYLVGELFFELCLIPIFEATDTVSTHLTGWLLIAIVSAVDAVCFFFSRYVLHNKVNLVG